MVYGRMVNQWFINVLIMVSVSQSFFAIATRHYGVWFMVVWFMVVCSIFTTSSDFYTQDEARRGAAEDAATLSPGLPARSERPSEFSNERPLLDEAEAALARGGAAAGLDDASVGSG